MSAIFQASSSTPTSVQPNLTASSMDEVSSTIQATPTSSVNIILSTSVAPVPTTTKTFEARITVNETYEPNYSNSSSKEFETFATVFNKAVGKFLSEELFGFERVEVKKLSSGSVVVDFDIVVQNSSNATVDVIVQVLKAGNGSKLGYTILGEVRVNPTDQPSPTATVKAPSPSTTPVAPTTKATEIWDKAIDLATPLGTFIIVVVAVALLLILLVALICVCCKYAKLKKKTRFPERMAINDSEWIRSSDDLLMWERNLRASEVKTTNGVSTRPVNDKRT